MKPVFIVVADNSRARIFTAESSSAELLEIETMSHPEGRQHEQDMVSDLPGKDAAKGGAGGHAYEDKNSPKQQQTIDFAKRVAHYLDDARAQNRLQQLLLVAAPAFLGELRNQLSTETRDCIVFELDKNLAQHSVDDIRHHLPEFLTH